MMMMTRTTTRRMMVMMMRRRKGTSRNGNTSDLGFAQSGAKITRLCGEDAISWPGVAHSTGT